MKCGILHCDKDVTGTVVLSAAGEPEPAEWEICNRHMAQIGLILLATSETTVEIQ